MGGVRGTGLCGVSGSYLRPGAQQLSPRSSALGPRRWRPTLPTGAPLLGASMGQERGEASEPGAISKWDGVRAGGWLMGLPPSAPALVASGHPMGYTLRGRGGGHVAEARGEPWRPSGRALRLAVGDPLCARFHVVPACQGRCF